MRAANMILIALIFIFSATSATNAMPDSFYKAMSNMKTENTICDKKYD